MSGVLRYFLTYYSTAFLLLFYPLGIDSQRHKKLGERCQFSPGVYGECKLLETCLPVYNAALANVKIEAICAYHNHLLVVCCPPKSVTWPPEESTTTDSTLPSTNPPLIKTRESTEPQTPKDIALRKCAEYATEAYKIVTPPILPSFGVRVKDMQCAIKSNTLIVGGSKSEPREFPHMAAVGFVPFSNLNRTPEWSCGATLVSDEFVLTAAHCTFSVKKPENLIAYWIRLGDLNIVENDELARPRTIRIAQRIKHPSYKRRYNYHDIALFKLATKVTFDYWIRPACLVHRPEVGRPPLPVITTGWGSMYSEGETSEHLLKVVLDLVPYQNCSEFWAGEPNVPQGIVDRLQICAGGGDSQKDACQGDSGGPLLAYNREHDCVYDVIGITSAGVSCGGVTPALYTRVENYLPWLVENLWG